MTEYIDAIAKMDTKDEKAVARKDAMVERFYKQFLEEKMFTAGSDEELPIESEVSESGEEEPEEKSNFSVEDVQSLIDKSQDMKPTQKKTKGLFSKGSTGQKSMQV